VSALTEIDADVRTWEAKWRAHVADYGATRTRFGR
jgi:hypothetical protein